MSDHPKDVAAPVVRLRRPRDPRVLELLSMHVVPARRAAKELGLAHVREELCRILEEYDELSREESTVLTKLLALCGPDGALDRVVAIAEGTSRPDPARFAAFDLLAAWAPELHRRLDPEGVVIDLLTKLVLFSMRVPEEMDVAREIFLGIDEAGRPKAVELLEHLRRSRGAPAWPIHAPLLDEPALAAIHPALVDALDREAGPEALAVLERVAKADGPAASKARRVLLRERNAKAGRPPPDESFQDEEGLWGSVPGRTSTFVSYPDGRGDVVVEWSVSGEGEAGAIALLRLRLGRGVRDGEYRFHEDLSDTSDYVPGRIGGWHQEPILVPRGEAIRLVAEELARTPAADRLGSEARTALAVFRRDADRLAGRAEDADSRDADDDEPIEEEEEEEEEEEITSEDAVSLETWRNLLEHRFHPRWRLDAGDLAAAGVPPPTNAAELVGKEPTDRDYEAAVPEFSRDEWDRRQSRRAIERVPEEWIRDAAARFVGTPVRERLARMLEFTAWLLGFEGRPKRAALYRREARRVREEFERSVFVRAVLERSALRDERAEVRAMTAASEAVELVREFLVPAGGSGEQAQREVAAADFAEGVIKAIAAAAENGLFVEDRPAGQELVRVAEAVAARGGERAELMDGEVFRGVLLEFTSFSAEAAARIAPAVCQGVLAVSRRSRSE